jgi:uncharacterized repeat protein (TIGR04138 family)
MSELPFHLAVAQAANSDSRYAAQAYEFVREALHVAIKTFREGQEDQHVSGQEVLEGVRLHALSEYGPMAYTLLEMWGLHRGEDIGEIVYNLIQTGYFGKNENDSIQDFSGGFDFQEAFNEPFLPQKGAKHPNPERRI